MRTTMSIDDDVLEAARYLAGQQKVAVGKVLSELARKGLERHSESAYTPRGDFPTFAISEPMIPITPEHVRSIDDEA